MEREYIKKKDEKKKEVGNILIATLLNKKAETSEEKLMFDMTYYPTFKTLEIYCNNSVYYQPLIRSIRRHFLVYLVQSFVMVRAGKIM